MVFFPNSKILRHKWKLKLDWLPKDKIRKVILPRIMKLVAYAVETDSMHSSISRNVVVTLIITRVWNGKFDLVLPRIKSKKIDGPDRKFLADKRKKVSFGNVAEAIQVSLSHMG